MPKIDIAITKDYKILMRALPATQKMFFDELKKLIEVYRKSNDLSLDVKVKKFQE